VDQQASSDHHSFWQYGYTAIRDRYLDRDPEYHTTGDTIGPFEYVNCGTNNIPMYTEAIKATVATLAKLAGPSPRTGIEDRPQPPASSFKLAAVPSVFRNSVCLVPSTVDPRRLEPSALHIYDAQGRLVRVLAKAGVGPLTWDCRDSGGRRAGPGVYLFRLTSSDVTATARAILAE
jgi:hypothetical protein